MLNELCADSCDGHSFFGTEFCWCQSLRFSILCSGQDAAGAHCLASQCFCGLRIHPQANLSKEGNYNDACSGSSLEVCGGVWSMSIYQYINLSTTLLQLLNSPPTEATTEASKSFSSASSTCPLGYQSCPTSLGGGYCPI